MATNDGVSDNAQSSYRFESLSLLHQGLLISICKNVTGASLGEHSSEFTEHLWDGVAFKNFVERMFPEERELFLTLLAGKDVKYQNTFKKIKTEGVGEHTARKVFCCSAEAQQKPLEMFLREYILYTNSIGMESSRFFGHEDTIKNLLDAEETDSKKRSEEINLLQISPQDTIAIHYRQSYSRQGRSTG